MAAEGRLLIVRFAPFSAEGCRKNAENTYLDDLDAGRPGRYGVSASGVNVAPHETVDDGIVRLRSVVSLRGKHVAPVWADVLVARGWVVVPDMPPDEHYLIGRAGMAVLPDFDDLALLWNDAKRVCPTWGSR